MEKSKKNVDEMSEDQQQQLKAPDTLLSTGSELERERGNERNGGKQQLRPVVGCLSVFRTLCTPLSGSLHLHRKGTNSRRIPRNRHSLIPGARSQSAAQCVEGIDSLMANKLNAFLASVPANANGLPSPVGHKMPPPVQTAFPELSLKAAPVGGRTSSKEAAIQPATPQPQQQRHHASRRNKKFERHFSTSSSARNLATVPVDANEHEKKIGNDADDGGGDDVNGASNQVEEDDELKNCNHRQAVPLTPLKAFNPKQKQTAASKPIDASESSEAGPLRRLSAQGSHHRRVSTDTTMFNRYLRQQADRDISMDVVQHFSNVPVVTVSRTNQLQEAGAFDAGCEALNNNNEDENDDNNRFSSSLEHRSSRIDPHEILTTFRRGGAVSTSCALEILKQATNLMSLEQNVITIQAPYTLVGDLHGQFQDLLEIFKVHGSPSLTNPFLFLGDYVDRGISSCEIVLLLLAFKVCFPSSVHLLRGNHECRSLSTFYGFRAECLKKYGTLVYNRMIKCFESMPLAAKLETSYGVFLAVHGGLSPEIVQLEDINENVDRFMEPEPNGALCDLLWSDPAKDDSGDDSHEEQWAPNSVRGCSFTFNAHACRAFLKRNELLAIIRAHELEEDGFREHFISSSASHRNDKRSSVEANGGDEEETTEHAHTLTLPPVITVFSAPEYCNTNHNMGATLMVPWAKRANGSVLEYRQHTRSVHREHEFAQPSEDLAVKDFLKEHLPFLPVDFYDLIVHCRQLRQMLVLSSQSSVTQLPLVSIASGDVLSTTGGANKAAFALELSPAGTPSASRSGHQDARLDRTTTEGEEDQGPRSEHTTTEEHSAVDREEEEASSVPGGLTLSASRQKRRKQQQKSKTQEEPEQLPTTKTTVASSVQVGRAEVLSHPTPVRTAPVKPHNKSRTIGGWKLCPGFLRFYDRLFGSKNKPPTDLKSVPVGTGEASSLPNSAATTRTSLSAVEPMNNQLSSSEDVAVSPSSTATTAAAQSPFPQSPQQQQLNCHEAASDASVFATAGVKPKGTEVFSKLEWQALKLYFTLLDVSGNGVLMEESFVVLLAEQDSDAYATEDELTLLMEVIDTNADGLITEQDFLLFAHRSYLRWKKMHKKDVV